MRPSWRQNYLRYQSFFLNVYGQYKQRADIRAYVEIMLSLVTISFFAIFALRPVLLTIAGLLKEIESRKATVVVMDEKIRNLAAAQTLYDREKGKISILKTAIPENPSPDVFARQIEGLSNKHQTSLSELSIGEAVILGTQTEQPSEVNEGEEKEQKDVLPQNASYLDFSVNLQVSLENYSSLSGFLNDIEKLRRPVNIASFRISREEDQETSSLILAIEGKTPNFSETK